ncbi:MAG TPA: four-carbon acid sugar kinase family protein, partial [Anaeromyxobacteraceae bacterium]|nr:four-carbon acid sugar kinase family protein [Anaeromyxobacteraceae bacterium]
MLDVAVIADDLTGAADCGVALSAAGLPTFVALAEAAPPRASQVVAFDTDSRAVPEREAVERTRRATERALAAGARAVYRKLDSTLRGHVGRELAAVVRAVGVVRGARPLCVLAPAFPATGRTTRGGRVLVRGVPLEETEVWRDARVAGPAEPAAMLGAAGLSAEVIPLDSVRGGPGVLRGALLGAAALADAVVCDAEVDADLAAIATAAAGLDRPVAWAGSAGLA